jgi:hypothetical protein
MKRKEYQKPTVLVVKLQQQNHILTVSNSNANMQDYTLHDYEEE